MNKNKSLEHNIKLLNNSFNFTNSKEYSLMLNDAIKMSDKLSPIIKQNSKLIASLEPSINQINSLMNSNLIKDYINQTEYLTRTSQNYLSLIASFNKYRLPEMKFLSKSILEWRENVHLELESKLKKKGNGYYTPWLGAWESWKGNNPDKARHCACSMRELLTKILHENSSTKELRKKHNIPKDKNPTRKQRIESILEKDNNIETKEKIDLINQIYNTIEDLQGPTHNQKEISIEDEELKELLISAELAIDILITSIDQSNSCHNLL